MELNIVFFLWEQFTSYSMNQARFQEVLTLCFSVGSLNREKGRRLARPADAASASETS